MAQEKQKKIHPHKFTLWVAIASILMMFAGLTSAYIVKRNQANWVSFELPVAFWYSTAAIAASSITLFLASRSYKSREIPKYRRLMTATIILGVLFYGRKKNMKKEKRLADADHSSSHFDNAKSICEKY